MIRTTKHLFNEDGHTTKQWYAMIDDLRRCIVEVESWVYYHFLESVPPLYPENKIGFFNSEPLDHTAQGEPIFYYFFKFNNKYYGCITTFKTQEFCYRLAKEALEVENARDI